MLPRAAALLRAAILLALGGALVFPRLAKADVTTGNSFVSAMVTTDGSGLLTIFKGNPANSDRLTYEEESFLTIKTGSGNDVKYYSNNTNSPTLGPGGTPLSVDVTLSNGQTSKIADTIQTIWPENGFDIVQDVYPVAFTQSGVIVLSIKIINHSGIYFPVQAQFLLDNENSNDSTNDNPWILTRYGLIRNWQNNPPNPMPSFYLAFDHPPYERKLGTVGIGYINDTFPPRPLGLLPLSLVQFGDWPSTLVFTTWGPAASSGGISDVATLMQGQTGLTANAAPGDTVTEIMRTAYGTPEWCYDHGHFFGFALYPHHLSWDPLSRTYTPNPFHVETFLYNLDLSAASNVTIRQTLTYPGNPIHIVSPKPAGPPNTQLQKIGTISGYGFGKSFGVTDWIDSALVLPTGCASSFDVNLRFDVTAGNINPPIFDSIDSIWNCDINVDCPNPDTLPPTFQNSFDGCDSIFGDTITAQEARQYDLGLDSITYTSPDLTPSQYLVTFRPLPPFDCTKNPVKIFVTQVDTFQSGHVILTFTDCAGNVSRDTICFTAHPPLPDLTAPQFFDSTTADCHALCKIVNVTDTLTSDTSIDRGVDSIVVVSDANMTLSGIPSGGKYPAGTPEAALSLCVTDSMQDGTIILRATDTAHNVSYDTIHYCTTPDTLAPVITDTGFDAAGSSWHVSITEIRPWDRGIDSVWLTQASNVVTNPTPLAPVGCPTTYDFRLIVVDTNQCASAMVHAKDCWGNVDSQQFSFTKGAIPVIVASNTTLCSDTDSAMLDAGTGFTGYEWSNGDTTEKITVGPGVYSVTVQEGAGCPATSLPDTITLALATTQITPPGPITLCAPDSAQLDAGAGFATYQWLKDGVTMTGTTSEKIWASASGSYSVQVTNAAGCAGTSPAVKVTINPLPAQPVITAISNVMTSTPAASYQWSLDSVPIPGATHQTDTAQFGGSYTVTVTDSNGCSNTSLPFSTFASTVVSVPAMVLAHESNHVLIPLSLDTSQGLSPTVSRTFTAIISFNKTLLVPNGSPTGGTLVSSVVQGNRLAVEYTGASKITKGILENLPFIAALGDDTCTTVTIDTFYWGTPNISVTTRDGNFCLTGLCTQGGTRLINPNGAVTLSTARPNPAYTSVQIDYSLIEQGHTTLTVYDLLGHEVLRLVDADLQPGSYTVDADVSSLPPGTYIYSLRTPTIVKSDHLQIAR